MNYQFDIRELGSVAGGRVAGFGGGCRLAGINMTAGIKALISTSVLVSTRRCAVVFVLRCVQLDTPL